MGRAGGVFNSVRAFEQKFKGDMKRLKSNLNQGLALAAKQAAEVARENAPMASGYLRESIHADGLRVICDAPYALFVERGSRPHFPPIGPILAWVELKGFVGVGPGGAKSVAFAIANKIAKEGTEPTWFLRRSIPAAVKFVGVQVVAALRRT